MKRGLPEGKRLAVFVSEKRTVSTLLLNEPILDALQGLVGGYIEISRPSGLPHPFVMIVDDEGKLKGKAVNKMGSLIYGYAEHGKSIVGDAVIIKEIEDVDGERDICTLDLANAKKPGRSLRSESLCSGQKTRKEGRQVDG